MRRVARILFAALLRGLAAIGGAVAGYGATGMFTSDGIAAPNGLVVAGLATCVALAAVLWSHGRSVAGLWPALLIVAVPYALYAWGSWAVPECPQPHPPIGSAYSCTPVGSHAIGIVSPLVAVLGAALFVHDIRALARR